MGRVNSFWIMGFGVIFALAGCAKEQEFAAVERICVPGTDKAKVMAAAEDTLGKFQFRLAKADTESGYVRSQPLSGGQFFEFWRKDNVGDFSQVEANLHSIRRTVELDIRQEDSEVCVACDVRVERLNLPEGKVTSGARAYSMFTRSKRLMQRLELNPNQKKDMAWIDLGEDERLATLILQEIEKRLTAN